MPVDFDLAFLSQVDANLALANAVIYVENLWTILGKTESVRIAALPEEERDPEIDAIALMENGFDSISSLEASVQNTFQVEVEAIRQRTIDWVRVNVQNLAARSSTDSIKTMIASLIQEANDNDEENNPVWVAKLLIALKLLDDNPSALPSLPAVQARVSDALEFRETYGRRAATFMKMYLTPEDLGITQQLFNETIVASMRMGQD